MNFNGKLALKSNEIEPNFTKRQFVKDDMNIVLGKFCEQTNKSHSVFVKSHSELTKVFYKNEKEIENIFPFHAACYVQVKTNVKSRRMNIKACSVIYSIILALSRIFMDKQMRQLWKIQAKIFAISNDCLYFSMPKNSICPIQYSNAIGFFKSELKKNEIVLSFISLGPKTSCLAKKNQTEISYVIKARGFSLNTSLAKKIITEFDFQNALEAACAGKRIAITIPQLRLRHKIPELTSKEMMYLCLFSNDINFVRILCDNFTTKPFGYVK